MPRPKRVDHRRHEKEGGVVDWTDYNGHMNDAEYARVFSLAVEALMDRVGLDEAGRAEHGYTIYTLETHLCYRQEAHRGEALAVALTLLDSDAKRLHVLFTLTNADDDTLATSEQMLMGIDVASALAAYGPASSPQDGARTSKTGAAVFVAPASLLGVARPVRSGAGLAVWRGMG